ncbi:hypothetical protein L6164_014171 [Bauhinia variegata]|uniref:Uncharacterized protein n=1 Tax=Bauhinia variegata TaxID=167791 RepID=A0ACB9NGB5_BAUVA|nr:hypothetical protein L6164_014171 [Bauhinia variegata]
MIGIRCIIYLYVFVIAFLLLSQFSPASAVEDAFINAQKTGALSQQHLVQKRFLADHCLLVHNQKLGSNTRKGGVQNGGSGKKSLAIRCQVSSFHASLVFCSSLFLGLFLI